MQQCFHPSAKHFVYR